MMLMHIKVSLSFIDDIQGACTFTNIKNKPL